MTRQQFETEKEEAETFRKKLEESGAVKTDKIQYSDEKNGIDYLCIFLQNKRETGKYSYERQPNGIYICTLDLPINIETPGRTIFPETIHFTAQGIRYLHKASYEEFRKKGFIIRPTLGMHHPTVSFAHQAIESNAELSIRYDMIRKGQVYECALDVKLTLEEYEKIKELLHEWTKEYFNQTFSLQNK